MQVFTATQLAEYIRVTLERDAQLRDVWVTGEVSNVFRSGAGHVYFILKDSGAVVKSVLFSGNAGAEHLVDGAQVNLHGRVSHYTARGETQLYADAVVPAGLGALAAEFELLRAKLEAEGLFDPSRKRPLPQFPTIIGVVTSEQGAVIHDITHVLANRYPLAEVVLFPATVQGDNAPGEIAEGIRAFNTIEGISVIIVGRGGGSMEDLWAFNTEIVARAIHASHIPVVSAVGHESDFTIADFVADLRAPTPSAAAAVSPDIRELQREVFNLTQHARQSIGAHLMQRSRDVESLVDRMKHTLPDTASQRQRVDDVLERGRTALGRLIASRKEQTAGLAAALSALNPVAVLDRGFAVLTKPGTGETVASVADAAPGDIVRARVRDGSFDAEVKA
ncbi:MAG: exodeoxyribonuclease VII large subunit [Chloroflexi bacterium]|nr:exodeoxyribonuclease VII large subunit [Chloroflexota bacterium]